MASFDVLSPTFASLEFESLEEAFESEFESSADDVDRASDLITPSISKLPSSEFEDPRPIDPTLRTDSSSAPVAPPISSICIADGSYCGAGAAEWDLTAF